MGSRKFELHAAVIEINQISYPSLTHTVLTTLYIHVTGLGMGKAELLGVLELNISNLEF